MESPTISVIIPIYNVEPYLRRCLDSIVSQTYTNLEIILVDDGSQDGCGAICDEYSAWDTRFTVLHTENQGVYPARNHALAIAKGEYICFIDGDDWIEPEMLGRLLDLAESSKADIVQCELINDGSYAQIRSKRLGDTKSYVQAELTRAMFREEISHSLLGKMFKAEFWETRRFPEQYYHADAMLMAQIGIVCQTYARIDDVLYHYNTGNYSITRGKKTPLHIVSMEKLFSIYSEAAQIAVPEGAFFICREIPSAGRVILPGGDISVKMAIRHVWRMHDIFLDHWAAARQAEEYRHSPWSKRLLWHIYRWCPALATILSFLHGRLSKV